MKEDVAILSQSEPVKAGLKRRLERFARQLSTDSDKVIFDDKVWDILEVFFRDPENANSVREELNRIEYAQSRKDASQIPMQIQRFVDQHKANLWWNPIYRKAKEQRMKFYRQFRLTALKYYSDEDIIDAIPKLTTHAGWTFIESGKKSKGDNLEKIYQRYLEEENKARKEGKFSRPVLPGVRTQNSSPYESDGTLKALEKIPRSKTRLVCMMDLMMIIAELKFQKPLQKVFDQLNFYAGGKTPKQLRTHIARLRGRFKFWLTLDYSHYDQSMPAWLIRDAFDSFRQSFSWQRFDQELWDVLVNSYLSKDFVTLSGTLARATDGNVSGAMFTQAIGTECNRLMVTTYLYSLGMDETDFEVVSMGDDILIFTNRKLDKDIMAHYINDSFGIEVNALKCAEGDTKTIDPEFLSRTWRYEGEWRHWKVLLTKLLYPERRRNYDNDGTRPSDVIFGYCLTYPLGMNELINMKEFLDQYCPTVDDIDDKALNNLPGSVRFQSLANMTKLEQWSEEAFVRKLAS